MLKDHPLWRDDDEKGLTVSMEALERLYYILVCYHYAITLTDIYLQDYTALPFICRLAQIHMM